MSQLFKDIEHHYQVSMDEEQLADELVSQLCLGQSLGGYDTAGVIIDVVADRESDLGDALSAALNAIANGIGAHNYQEKIVEMLVFWCNKQADEFLAHRREEAEAKANG